MAKGDKLATLEAMKMQTTVYAPADGVVGGGPGGGRGFRGCGRPARPAAVVRSGHTLRWPSARRP